MDDKEARINALKIASMMGFAGDMALQKAMEIYHFIIGGNLGK